LASQGGLFNNIPWQCLAGDSWATARLLTIVSQFLQSHEARCIPPVLRTDVCQIAKISILFHQINAAEKDGKDFGPEV